MKRRSPSGEIVNRSALARFMGVSPPTIDIWLAGGCPVLAEPEAGMNRHYRFDTAAVVRWRIDQAVLAAGRKTTKEQG
jgi:phage terminase Nu1 subunit (DNA packaging protein)